MLKVVVKEGENIDRALKRYKRKFRNVKILQELRQRKHFTKPSVAKRAQVQKAAYVEQKFKTED
ncbi:30S ribosomal protein S21 [Tenacibaculum holothuriorum]|uniref:Small ribosomal subunit protein bS21 n=1 Tax=Tenacibaculum holothuriorum TaxID=1635173 RepID=A0A1Y2PFT9_9FLAO|nr:30S ribosomal protein S21 [Tenacibaculum holothuriorum]OSY88538.1 30S ribosomal protein S21 [Tenacibaculum holothuriorum]